MVRGDGSSSYSVYFFGQKVLWPLRRRRVLIEPSRGRPTLTVWSTVEVMNVDGVALSVAKALFRTWFVDLISAARFLAGILDQIRWFHDGL